MSISTLPSTARLFCLILVTGLLAIFGAGCNPVAPTTTTTVSTPTETIAVSPLATDRQTPTKAAAAVNTATLTSTTVPSLTPSPTPVPLVAQSAQRALWLWQDQIAIESELQSQFFQFVREKEINTVFLYAYDLIPDLEADLATFLASSGELDIELLIGDPDLALVTNHSDVLAFVRHTVIFVQGLATGKQPTAIHIDIEPYLLDGWATDQASLITQYLNLLQATKNELSLSGSTLALAVDIPFWFDTIVATYNGEEKPLNQHIQDIADYVVLMDYRDTAVGDDGILYHAANELIYGLTINKPVMIGVETNCIEPDKITFCEEGAARMELTLSETFSAVGTNPIFHGFAIHDYVGYQQLALPEPTSTATLAWTPEPTITPTATPICGRFSRGMRSPDSSVVSVSYMINDGQPQAIFDGGVIQLREGDILRLSQLYYCADADGQNDRLAIEAYVRKNDDFDYTDGRFNDGVEIDSGTHELSVIDGIWQVEAGWDRLVIVLIHYFADSHEIEDRFFINLTITSD